MSNKMDIVLRKEQPEDYRAVEELTREAFWNRHVPGCDEHYLLHVMRSSDSFIPELDMVAEVGGEIVGNIVYTKAIILDDNGKSHEMISFGPLSVLPRFQGRGIGGALIEFTKNAAKGLGYKAILIYGDPLYYCRFGFVAAETFKIGTADDMFSPALQALELVAGALSNIEGRFVEDAVYHVDESAGKEFDKAFAPKELRDDLPSQARFRHLAGIGIPRKKPNENDCNVSSSSDDYLKRVTVGERKPHNATITLMEYDPHWPDLFDREAKRIRSILGSRALQLEHVGSTSVPGLCAKPIIDILLVVADSSEEQAYVPDLETAGYALRIREPDWFQHRMLKGPDTDVNLHVFSEGASEIKRMLSFRDWLRTHDADRENYARIKRELARHVWRNVQDYADAKTTIIKEIMERARD